MNISLKNNFEIKRKQGRVSIFKGFNKKVIVSLRWLKTFSNRHPIIMLLIYTLRR